MVQIKWCILPVATLMLIITNFGILAAQKRQNVQSARTGNDATGVSLQQLYDNSVQAQEQGDLNRARALLEQIQHAAPEYQDVKKRIKTLDSLIALEVKKAQNLREQLRSSGASLDLGLNTGTPQGATRAVPKKDLEQKLPVTSRARDKFDIDLTPPPDLAMVQKVRENWGLNPDSGNFDSRSEKAVADSENVKSALIIKNELIKDQEPQSLPAPDQQQIKHTGQISESTLSPVTQLVGDSTRQQPEFSMIRARSAFDSSGSMENSRRQLLSGWMRIEQPILAGLPESGQTADTLQVLTTAQYDSLYRCALVFMERQEWHNANVILRQLYSLNPAYRNLSTVYTQVQERQQSRKLRVLEKLVAILSKTGALFLMAVLMIGLIVFIGCRWIFSPVLCARLYLRLGQTERAIKLCEKFIVRNPGQQAYSCLASIYLKMVRTDVAALKVYQIALKLNPNGRLSEQLSSILAQNYLSANRSDADAVEVMEKAISMKIQNKENKA